MVESPVELNFVCSLHLNNFSSYFLLSFFCLFFSLLSLIFTCWTFFLLVLWHPAISFQDMNRYYLCKWSISEKTVLCPFSRGPCKSGIQLLRGLWRPYLFMANLAIYFLLYTQVQFIQPLYFSFNFRIFVTTYMLNLFWKYYTVGLVSYLIMVYLALRGHLGQYIRL